MSLSYAKRSTLVLFALLMSAETRCPSGAADQPAHPFHRDRLQPLTIGPDGRTVHIAGQIAVNQQGAVVGIGDFRAEAGQVFENLCLALESVGATFDDVL